MNRAMRTSHRSQGVICRATRCELLERRMLLSLAPAGAEFRVNTFTTNAQDSPAVASDADGDFVVVWNGNGSGDGGGIFAQRYDAAGVAQGSEFRVNTTTTNLQSGPSVAMDADGDFVVAWDSRVVAGHYDIFAQRYNAAGVAQGPEFLVNTFTTSEQRFASVAMDSSGNFVIAWQSLAQQSANTRGIYAQRYNALGVAQGGEFHVNTITTDNHRNPSAAMDADGDFVITWSSDSGSAINAQRYDSTGVPVGAEFNVNGGTNGGDRPEVAMDASGDFVAAWNSYDALARRYNAAGVPQGPAFRVNTVTTQFGSDVSVAMDADGDFLVGFAVAADGSGLGVFGQSFNAAGVPQGSRFLANSFTTGTQRRPAVALDGDGDAVITWQSLSQDGSGYGVYAQRYEGFPGAPNPAGGEFRVNTFTTSLQFAQAVASDADGDLVVVWAGNGSGDSYGIFAQRYSSAGVPQGIEFRVNTTTTRNESDPAVAMDADGDFVVAWSTVGGVGDGVFAQRFDSSGAAQGAEFLVTTSGLVPTLAADDNGNFVVVWEGSGAGDPAGLFARRFDSSGNPQGDEFRVNTSTTHFQGFASMAMNADGDFVVTWMSHDGAFPFPDSYGLFAQRYNAGGVAQGGEFRVDTTDQLPGFNPSVGMDADGDFVIAWHSQAGPGDPNTGVFAQRYSPAGELRGSEFRANRFTFTQQTDAAVAMDADGDFIVAWVSDSQDGSDDGIFGQRFDAAAVPQGSEFRVNTFTTGRQFQPVVAKSDNTGLVVAWNSAQQPGGNSLDVYAQRYTVPLAVPVVVASSFQPDPPPQRVCFDFSQNVSASLSTADFVLENLTTSQTIPSGDLSLSYDLATNTATLTYTGSGGGGSGILPLGDYRATIVAAGVTNPAGTALDANYVMGFSIPLTVRRGSEFQVNTFTPQDQQGPATARDVDGDLVVVWESRNQDGSDFGIYAQRFNAAGVPQGGEFRVNTFTTGRQDEPAVAMDAAGNFVVVWTSSNQDLSGNGIYAQRYNAAGVPQGGEVRVNTITTSFQEDASVEMHDNGDFVIVWHGNGATDVQGVFAQRYDAAGVPQGGEFRVNTFTTNIQFRPAVASDIDGDFVVVWQSSGQEGSGSEIYAQRYNAAGVPQGGEFRINAITLGDQGAPSVAMDDDGDFVVAWVAYEFQGLGSGVFARRFDAAGAAQGTDFHVNTTLDDDQTVPVVGMDGPGNFVITWSGRGPGDDVGVFVQRYNFTGVAIDSEFRVNTFTTSAQQFPSIAMDPSGEFVMAWSSLDQDGSGFGVYAQKFAPQPPAAVTDSSFIFLTRPHSLKFTFTEKVSISLGTEDIVLENLTAGGIIPASDIALSYDLATNTATFTYTGNASGLTGVLPDGNYRATLLRSGITVGGVPMTANHVFDFFFLNGDANRDGRVNLNDFNILAANFGQLPRDFTQGDFDYDTAVFLSDFNILASRFGAVLTAPDSYGPAFTDRTKTHLLWPRDSVLQGKTTLETRFSSGIIQDWDELMRASGPD